MTTQVVILRAVRSFAPNLARLTGATTAFFNTLIESLTRPDTVSDWAASR
jgi:hypothetical protein